LKNYSKRFHLLWEIIRTSLHGPETVRYPFGDIEMQSGLRGKLVMDPELCIGCGLCVRDCPGFALVLEKQDRHNFKLIYTSARCAFCGLCEMVCQKSAIRLVNEFVPAVINKDALIEVLVNKEVD